MAFLGSNLADHGSHRGHRRGGSGGINYSTEPPGVDYPGVLDADLAILTAGQLSALITAVCILTFLSLCGNIGTLHVNCHRKMRPFFRACLISLAFSDVLSTIFLTTAYMGQFTAQYLQIWNIGELMCHFIPFISTAAILASSLTLVGIALDRYFAVMRAVLSFWNPGTTFCWLITTGIWGVSVAVALPLLWVYNLYPVYLLTEQSYDNDDSTSSERTTTSWQAEASQQNFSYILVKEERLVNMCISAEDKVLPYYAIVFALIFAPCVISFVWLNSIIANKLWTRRHAASSVTRSDNDSNDQSAKVHNARWKCKCVLVTLAHKHIGIGAGGGGQSQSSSITFPTSLAQTTGMDIIPPHRLPLPVPQSSSGDETLSPSSSRPVCPPLVYNPATCVNQTREARHIRMFTIIILMMAVFLLFRLPTWIFLLMRMYGSYSRTVDWLIYFSFGCLNLCSCVMNPLFYTFLTETLQYAMMIKVKVFGGICGLKLCKPEKKIQTLI